MEWISVKDRLPKLNTDAVWGFEPMEKYTGKVLYWMPLPEPPKNDFKE